jgi:crossover junction endodeoxyribonuclease RuvC
MNFQSIEDIIQHYKGGRNVRFLGIDPATRTGLVALDENRNVLLEKELKGKGKGAMDARQLVSLENLLYQYLQPEDEILIEDAAGGTQKGITTGMIHGGIRTIVIRKKLAFNLVNPLSVKKYVGVTGWTGEIGNKRRLNNKEQKAAMKAACMEHFGYTHKSDNVIDAYIIARISLNLYLHRELKPMIDTAPYQIEVVQDILEKRMVAK